MAHGCVNVPELWQGSEVMRVSVRDPFVDVPCDVLRPGFQGYYLACHEVCLDVLLASAGESVETGIRPVGWVVTIGK